MGINVRVQDAPKSDGIIVVQVNLEKDLKDCMRCRFFYGSSRQCIAKQCVKKEREAEISEPDMGSECFECPYRQSEKYCFPCMKRILGKVKDEQIRKRHNETTGNT